MPNLDGLKQLRRGFALCLAVALGTLTAVSAASQTDRKDEEDKNLVGTAVVLRTLDKVTATTKDYTVKIGDTLDYGSLSITARHCEKRPPTEIPETYAFLQITDVRLNGEGDVVEASSEDDDENMIFSGWMYASKPAVSALDHRVYDVWVIECQVPESAMEGSLRR
ncbi:DUF2155 domain-containing protein [Litorimonas haliclonae]|uniref:DUF2155 domain-containing protein n=1 Tax=Litorimonas haliclonae TaxID=2081977 RepID=UPI0039F066BD